MKTYLKTFVIIISIVVLLLIITLINVYKKNNFSYNKLKYENKLNEAILSDDVLSIDYDYLINDINKIGDILKNQLSSDVDIKKKSEYYKIAQSIYDNKLNEIVRVLNDRLDDEDFEYVLIDMDEFYKNIDIAIEEIKATNKSSIDLEFNTNKYIYEEKQRKCLELIENYKGFLKENVWKS